MKVRIETITPTKAKEYLLRTKINRNLSKERVEAYAYDMSKGAWQLNGEAIRFNESGDLIDGQHRLSAIIKSGASVQMVVMTDVSDSVSVYDRGRTRSVVDGMIINNMDRDIANTTNVAIAKLYYVLNGVKPASDFQVKEFIENHKETLLMLKPIWSRKHRINGSSLSVKQAPILLACMYALESGENIEDITNFCEIYRSGLYESKEQTAAIVCRNGYLRGEISSHNTEKRILAERIFEKAIYDFCAHYNRIKPYKNITNPTYSVMLKTKEA